MMLNPTDRYLLKKGKNEGKLEGKREGKLEVAKKLLAKGFQIEEIIELTGLTKEDLLKENIS